ncbi:Dam family site-specific DNA-(adenine-N6)-methyltransferase [Listeria booriae]|uniref:site-specific DNA-methyltransferase (adenine-specific) n=1 Tax=Listeria booriae TaxID=1552123 RepID=A0A7X1DKG1_9LIST|nr:Dam family site-specific DNA-(adenine-N6)-methyltransferase [Listeria booriae]MBC1211803.1 Dam family site-specific DNA-(adenine-N6)-methyltransferase [Listeria booriae]MBC1795953.1 Dam family site-specific DNA-(adenine-N6)-methyltransferase [Listeria booriae]MBC2283136.1 Dam family site-specific DNA-(adenine-N6)-methyltransferase [Listeria booriae]MBC2291865.1 Dam family site-specific DNA-(adenine-N6)-methyltransferase [Listeria booriae]MBC2310424.1 Dam family site-specific DNA-(adenine-N6
MNDVISSPIRWTGSKRKLLNEMLYVFDREKEIYVEPFLGSGTVLLNVLKNELYNYYYVNDINSNLIDFYKSLKDNYGKLSKVIIRICKEYNSLMSIDEKEAYYYSMRERYNNNRSKVFTRAAIFWFLMKSGYNGVYRINSNGKFNVPFGKKNTISFDLDSARYISELIQPVRFYSLEYADFIEVIAKKGILSTAFLYCDPPYIPETKAMRNQILYTKNRFEHTDFVLRMLECNLKHNTTFMISMSDSESTDELYNIWNFNKIHICDIIRSVNPKKRLASREVAFLNYDIVKIECSKKVEAEIKF